MHVHGMQCYRQAKVDAASLVKTDKMVTMQKRSLFHTVVELYSYTQAQQALPNCRRPDCSASAPIFSKASLAKPTSTIGDYKFMYLDIEG